MKKEKKAPGREKIVDEKLPPEKYWDTLVKKVYFIFYSNRIKDEDGYGLWPDWSEQKRGIEASALKKIIIKLRTIAEAKNIEWTEAVAVDELHNFLQKAYNIKWIGKTMLCCVMNKFKDMIISSEYTPSLVEKVLNEWYRQSPDYTKDEDRDKTAAQIMIGFLKQQYLLNSITFNDASVMQSVLIIFKHVKADPWWSKKTFRSVANNLQEFITKIKTDKNARTQTNNGNSENGGTESSSDKRVTAIANFSIGTRESIRSRDSEGDKDQRC